MLVLADIATVRGACAIVQAGSPCEEHKAGSNSVPAESKAAADHVRIVRRVLDIIVVSDSRLHSYDIIGNAADAERITFRALPQVKKTAGPRSLTCAGGEIAVVELALWVAPYFCCGVTSFSAGMGRVPSSS
jgi:hypothetical protein